MPILNLSSHDSIDPIGTSQDATPIPLAGLGPIGCNNSPIWIYPSHQVHPLETTYICNTRCSIWRPSFTQILRPTHPRYPASSKSIKSPSLPLSFCLSPKVIAPAGRKPMTISSYNRNNYIVVATSLVRKTQTHAGLTWRSVLKHRNWPRNQPLKPSKSPIGWFQAMHLLGAAGPAGAAKSRSLVTFSDDPLTSSTAIHQVQYLFIWKCHQYLNKTPNKNKVNNTTQRWNSKGQVSLYPISAATPSTSCHPSRASTCCPVRWSPRFTLRRWDRERRSKSSRMDGQKDLQRAVELRRCTTRGCSILPFGRPPLSVTYVQVCMIYFML